MKKSKYIILVAHITALSLEELFYGHIDLDDPRLDGAPGTVQIEYLSTCRIAKKLIGEVQQVRQHYGQEAALQHLETYVMPWRIRMLRMTTGDAAADVLAQQYGETIYGQTVPVATA
jgi:hypothetical protein